MSAKQKDDVRRFEQLIQSDAALCNLRQLLSASGVDASMQIEAVRECISRALETLQEPVYQVLAQRV